MPIALNLSRRMGSFGPLLGGFARTIVRNRLLIGELVVRDLKGVHAGHSLGHVWVYIQPMIVVATYMLIFGVVIGTRINVTQSFPGDYTSYILIGMVPWLLMSNVLGRAPGAFSSNANLVKQVVFPIETLPVASMVACFLTFAPALLLMIVYKLMAGGGLSWLALALPLVLGAHFMLSTGVTLLLSVVTPFVRDIRELVTVYTAVSMYFTPAVYLPDWVPAAIRPVLYLNPFSYVVWVYQDVLFFGEVRHAFAWVVFALLAVLSLWAGLAVFQRVKSYLGNVL